jgi:electron transfer flavoprotein beta subunit
MNIFVCLKQVPARDSVIRVDEAGSWIEETDLSHEMNEPDAFALEEGLRLKEKHGGEVVAVSAGPGRAASAIREALAKGADRGILIEDDRLGNADTLAAARALAAALMKESCDLILTGLQSDDAGFGQTGVILAELLGLPHATIIMEVNAQDGEVNAHDGAITVKRELEAGWFQNVDIPLPALLTIQSGINKLRYATLMGIKKAKHKPLQRYAPDELGVDLAPSQIIRRLYTPQKTKQTQFLEGSPKEATAKLVEKLKFEARVL